MYHQKLGVRTMLDFEAIDAKMSRARNQLRSLNDDIERFCEEKARLIVPETDGGVVWWIYRGETSNPPIDWYIRVGEFAYNLRSALDHLVWQLVEEKQNKPDRWTGFPIQQKSADNKGANQRDPLRGVSCEARRYIDSVQPYNGDAVGIGHKLTNLNAIGNIDKHRRKVATSVRWTGIGPTLIDRLSWSDRTGTGGKKFIVVLWSQPWPAKLEYGQPLISANYVLAESEYLVFPTESMFEETDIEGEKWGGNLSVPETLHDCIVGVEMVIAHFKDVRY